MSQRTRIVIIAVVLAVIALALGLLGWLQRRPSASSQEPEPGKIHLYVDGRFEANLLPDDLTALPTASFADAEKGKTQEGPSLADIILLYVQERNLRDESTITVKGVRPSSGAAKEVTLTWIQVAAAENHVLLDFASSGTSAKLVSTLPELDTRDEWVQGVQRIDIRTRP